jgi:2-keto-4-pentenoate hydratase
LLDVQARRAAAETLWRLSAEGDRLPELPAGLRPADLSDGWAVQRALDALEGPRIGWKVASTSAASQQRFGIEEPLVGAMYERFLVPNHATVPATLAGIVEGEFAFRMSGDLGPESAPFSMGDVLACVGAVHAGAEVPDSRLANYPDVSTPQLVADFMLGRFYVLGDPLDIRPDQLRDVEVVIELNGAEAGRGTGRDVLGDPCNVLLWLARDLVRRGEQIRAGDLITTGACALVRGVQPGDAVVATFAARTKVGVSFAAGPDETGHA